MDSDCTVIPLLGRIINNLCVYLLKLEEIVKSGAGTVGSIAALSLTDGLPKKMTKTDAEDFIARLEREKWIGTVGKFT